MSKVSAYKQQVRGTEEQRTNRQVMGDMFEASPIPTDQMLLNLPLYMRAPLVAKMLHFNDMYMKILNIPGAIMEFGVWWGQNLALFENFRAVHEPYNHARRIVGFDTFEGYPEPSKKDRSSETLKIGGYTVSENYMEYLQHMLQLHENENVMAQIKKTELRKGNASETIAQYLADNPQTIVALACFDMALYEPTRDVLKALTPRLIKGSVIVFDELNCPEFPGETVALMETLGLRDHTIQRSRYLPDRSFLVVE